MTSRAVLRRRVRAVASAPPVGVAPTVTGFSPSTAPVGTLITITGTNFAVPLSVSFNGTPAVTFTYLTSTSCTAVVPSGATTGAITATTPAGSGTSGGTFTVGALSATRFLSRTNPTTGVTANVEYARGVTSTYDVTINETTGAVGADSILWNWPAERVGAARHAAITTNRITVTTTGSTGWADFVSAVSTARGGTGDWEIIVPTSADIEQDGEYELTFPNGRRLYVTAASLQTADVMPNRAGAFATFAGATFSRAKIWGISDAGTNVTLTGIRWKCRAEVAFAMLAATPSGTVTGLSDYASQIVLDRCQFDGNGRNDVRRGIIGNVNQMAMLETEVLDISANFENAGFGCWSGARFCYFRNVNLEASGIGFLPGGAAPALPNTGTLDPRDFFFYRCAATKRDNWMPPTSGTFAAGQGKDGTVRTVKNNWETKNIQRCTFFESAAAMMRGRRSRSS
jgi:IPT/TIG domain